MNRTMALDRTRHIRLLMAGTIACAVVLAGGPFAGARDASVSKNGASGESGSTGASSKTSSGAKSNSSSPSTTIKVKASENTKKARRQVNVLTASREEIQKKIDSLDAEFAAQEAAVEAAAEGVRVAQAAVAEANVRVAGAREEVRVAQEVVRQYALETYLHPKAVTSMSVLSIADTQDAGYASNLLKIMTDERHKVVETLAVKKKIAAMEEDIAQAAAKTAQERSIEAESNLSALDDLRGEQVQLIAQMDQRLQDALAEAAALEAIDEQAAKELAARELALRESEKVAKLASVTASKQPTLTNAVVKTPGSSTSSTPGSQSTPTSVKPTATTTTKPKATTTTKPSSPTTTTPSSPPSGIVTWAEIVYVGGIPVHKSVASQVSAMLNAATAAGFSLSGGGYRDSQSQIETRKANCGTTYYDIYEKPAGLCTPPTAIPGNSMHERGLALDLKSGGFLITSRSNPAFIWLSANASRFGFYNLPSEPWHWSTTGH